MTCFMISPRVAGLPSLPVFERSIAPRVKLSAKTGVLMTLGLTLMRGPVVAPQAGLVAVVATGVADAREGKADCDSVSNSRPVGT